jgi:hypothetical protein
MRELPSCGTVFFMSLDELALYHQTDKGSQGHNYCPHYERHLGGLQDQPIDLLEVGVYEGASLRMWADYFPLGQITGVDITPIEIDHPRITCIWGDIQLVELPDSPSYDIVIDDGSHYDFDIVGAWERLWGQVTSGGWYVIEDWQVQWEPAWGHSASGSKATKLADSVIHEVLAEAHTEVDEIHVYRQLLFVRKA